MLYEEVNLEAIRNKNEKRVQKLIPEVLAEYKEHKFQDLDVQDIYALTLNRLPARYTQRMTVVLKEPLSDETIKANIRDSAKAVMDNPGY